MNFVKVYIALFMGAFVLLAGVVLAPHAESAAPSAGAYHAYLPLTRSYRTINNVVLRDYVAVAQGRGVGTPYSDLYRVRADGSETIRLVDSPLHDFNASLSPDHRTILFSYSATMDPYARNDLRLMNSDSTNLRSLTTREAYNTGYWSSDNLHIAVESLESTETGNTFSLYMGTTDGEASLTLVAQEAENGGLPRFLSWSPDGTEFLYEYNINFAPVPLYLYTVATGQSTFVGTRSNGDLFAGVPLWSSDGAHLYYGGTDDVGSTMLIGYDTQTGVHHPLTTEGIYNELIAVVNNNTGVLVRRDIPDGASNTLYVVATDGSEERLVYDGNLGALQIRVSPTTDSMVFTDEAYAPNTASLYLQKLDGSAPIRVAVPNDSNRVAAYSMAWSPDGRSVAFHTEYQAGDVGVYKNLYVYDVTHPSSPARLLANDRGDPRWVGSSGYLTALVSLGEHTLYFYEVASGAGYESPLRNFFLETEWVYSPQ